MGFDYRIIRRNGEVVPAFELNETGAILEVYSRNGIKNVSCTMNIPGMRIDLPLNFTTDCERYYIVDILPIMTGRRQTIAIKITDCKNSLHEIRIKVG